MLQWLLTPASPILLLLLCGGNVAEAGPVLEARAGADCADDGFEPDDACVPSGTTLLGGESQVHDFCSDPFDWIAFNGSRLGNTDIWIVPTSGGEPRRLTQHSTSDRVLYWTPDGSGIVMSTSRGAHPWGSPLYIAPVDGGKSGGLARVAALERELAGEKSHVLLTLGGDFLSPSVASSQNRRSPQPQHAERGSPLIVVHSPVCRSRIDLKSASSLRCFPIHPIQKRPEGESAIRADQGCPTSCTTAAPTVAADPQCWSLIISSHPWPSMPNPLTDWLTATPDV